MIKLLTRDLRERLAVLEVVLDALISVLVDNETITRGEIQIELLKREEQDD